MDMSQYKQEFLSEARDHFDILNEKLLSLEKDPNDLDSVHNLFRAFHTLKGNAAMMGYNSFAETAHALEDLLSNVREHKIVVTRKIIDLLLEGTDLLEQWLDAIETGDEASIDSSHFLDDLEGISEKASAAPTIAIAEEFQITDVSQEAIRSAEEAGLEVFRVIVILDPDNPLKKAKALLAIRDIDALGDLIQTTPTKEEIVEGKLGTELEAIIGTNTPPEGIVSGIKGISGVREVIILGLDERYQKHEQIVHEEKESAKDAITREHHAAVVKEIRSVKVEMSKLDKLVNLMGELLISNIRLQEVIKTGESSTLRTVSGGIDRLILELQDQVMEIRMVPISTICRRFPRLVRDLAEKEGKEVRLVIEGAETEFDRTVLDQIGEPLVHLIRNGVDHGIEMPDERRRLGKPVEGTIKLHVQREKSHVVIALSDDGAGVDAEHVKQSCITKGIISAEEAEQLSEHDLRMLIFRPGVSTASKVTEVSGRGVGMDVVFNKVKELGGNLNLESEIGAGLKLTIRLPLTVAIMSALLVGASSEVYALPLTAVDQIVDIQESSIKTIQGNEVFLYRGTDLPLFRVWEVLNLPPPTQEKKACTVVVVSRSGQQIGLIVDTIVAQQQVLIKGLQKMVKGTRGAAGATILPDGRVVLVLDIDTLV